MRITFISDTHTKHGELTHDLPGGDLLIHAGDFMNSGYYKTEATNFLNWFHSISRYQHKIFIAGNHDRIFEMEPDFVKETMEKYPTLDYLEDFSKYLFIPDHIPVKVYGSPWQPEFYNWAFNLPRNGKELKKTWDSIPQDTDILITHGPAQGYLDTSGPPYNEPLLGCELLIERIKEIKPKIHVCGHIHGGYGYKFDGNTHFFNASVLDEKYRYSNAPLTVEWDPEKNTVDFLT